jgi:hypothetical protein
MTGAALIKEEAFRDGRLLPGTSLDDLLFILIRRACAQPSPEASDIGKLQSADDLPEKMIEGGTSDMIDSILRELRGRD